MHAHGLGEAGVLTAKAAEVVRIDITMECDRSEDVSRCQKITSHSGKLQENLLYSGDIIAGSEAEREAAAKAQAGKPKRDAIAEIDKIIKERTAEQGTGKKGLQDYSALDLLEALGAAFSSAKKAAASSLRALSRNGLPLDNPAAITAPIKGRIELRNVSFKYPAKKTKTRIGWWMDVEAIQAAKRKEKEEEEERLKKPPVINDLSLVIPAGTSCALVGKSGCGKSTLFQLLLRFYDVGRGQILIDGVDIRDYDLPSLRKQIACVEQQPKLFEGTLEENLCFGMDKSDPSYPTREQMEVACKRASFMDVLKKFPDGFDEVLGNKGRSLSGGQLQRLSIARAFLRNPSILLLDEITSAQDVESEVDIQAGINELMKGRTVISIAHRLATIAGCDAIQVLEEGRIIESGTHASLYRQGGKYKWMVDHQSLSRPGEEGEGEASTPAASAGGAAAMPAASAPAPVPAPAPAPAPAAHDEDTADDLLADAAAKVEASLRGASVGQRAEAIKSFRTLSTSIALSRAATSTKGGVAGGKCVCGCTIHNGPAGASGGAATRTATLNPVSRPPPVMAAVAE